MKIFNYVRERGEGLPRMFEEMEESSLPLPELDAEGQFFKVILRNTLVFDDETMSWLRAFSLEKLNVRQRRILAHTHQTGKNYFVLREYASINGVDKERAKKEIRALMDLGIIEVVGARKAAKYYPLLQRGTIEDKLREYFSRHDFINNADYRKLAGGIHRITAFRQLKDFNLRGLLKTSGTGKGTRYYPTQNLSKTSKVT